MILPDAQHAAVALELDATWATTDSDFGRFAGLRWTNLLTGATQVVDGHAIEPPWDR